MATRNNDRGSADSARKQGVGIWGGPKPRLGRVADVVANRVERLDSLGNGQVPAVVRLAWEVLSEGL